MGMGRSLSLRDLTAIRVLQRSGKQFDLERALLWPHTPLTAAFTGMVPLVNSGAETFVVYRSHDSRQAAGMLQARLRPGRPECVISFIAPTLEAEEATSIWYRLLNDLAQQAGERGVQRIYVQVVNNGPGPAEVLRQSGFVTYAHEDLFRLSSVPDGMARDPRLRRQRSRDAWNLLRLYTQTTPRPVLQAEGLMSVEEENGTSGLSGTVGWDPRGQGVTYVLEEAGSLAASVRIMHGPAAHWLRLWQHPDSKTTRDEFVRASVSLLHPSRRPVYVPVREYDSGFGYALESLGFEYLLKRSLMVKYTTVQVKQPALKLVPAIEKTLPVSQAQVRSK